MSKKPLIGITLDWEETGTFSDLPHYALRVHYFDAITKAGGIPIPISYNQENYNQIFDLVDGFVVPGGDFAYPLNWYENKQEQSPFGSTPRLNTDIEIINYAIKSKKPLLCICAGMQILSCLHGGKLTSNIKSNVKHKYSPRTDFAHKVTLQDNSLLKDIIGTNEFLVNSVHCEAICKLEENSILKIAAKCTEDNLIEAVEIDKNLHPFAIGVQWHPEFYLKNDKQEQYHFSLFKSLINNIR